MRKFNFSFLLQLVLLGILVNFLALGQLQAAGEDPIVLKAVKESLKDNR